MDKETGKSPTASGVAGPRGSTYLRLGVFQCLVGLFGFYVGAKKHSLGLEVMAGVITFALGVRSLLIARR